MPFPRVSKKDIEAGLYPKWDNNTPFDKECLKACGLPEDYHPDEYESHQIATAVMEDW